MMMMMMLAVILLLMMMMVVVVVVMVQWLIHPDYLHTRVFQYSKLEVFLLTGNIPVFPLKIVRKCSALDAVAPGFTIICAE